MIEIAKLLESAKGSFKPTVAPPHMPQIDLNVNRFEFLPNAMPRIPPLPPPPYFAGRNRDHHRPFNNPLANPVLNPVPEGQARKRRRRQ